MQSRVWDCKQHTSGLFLTKPQLEFCKKIYYKKVTTGDLRSELLAAVGPSWMFTKKSQKLYIFQPTSLQSPSILLLLTL